MTKSDLAILEKVFEREIYGHIYQSKSKRMQWLCDNGYIDYVEYVIPGRFQVTVKGWTLTHKGRMTYCETCKDVDLDEEVKP